LIIVGRNEFGEPADLFAYAPSTGQFGAWLGRIGLLGEQFALEPRTGEPLTVFRSPLEWLRAGRRGVVVLNADRARSLLWAAQPLAVDNRQFGLKLRAALIAPAPQILVNGGAV
jgi:hypothetical protein